MNLKYLPTSLKDQKPTKLFVWVYKHDIFHWLLKSEVHVKFPSGLRWEPEECKKVLLFPKLEWEASMKMNSMKNMQK